MLKPIFIVGCDRSGTTITKNIISTSANIVKYRFEPRLLIDGFMKFGLAVPLFRALKQAEIGPSVSFIMRQYEVNERFGWQQIYERKELRLKLIDLLENAADGNYEERLIDFFFTTHSKMQGREDGYFVDDTPSNVLIIDVLYKLFPNVKIVHCIRDGRYVAKSIMQKGWWGGEFRPIVNRWYQTVQIGRALGSKIPDENYIEFSLDKAFIDPEEEYSKLAEFLNIELTQGMLLFDPSRKSTLGLSESEQEYFVTISGDLMNQFNWDNRVL